MTDTHSKPHTVQLDALVAGNLTADLVIFNGDVVTSAWWVERVVGRARACAAQEAI